MRFKREGSLGAKVVFDQAVTSSPAVTFRAATRQKIDSKKKKKKQPSESDSVAVLLLYVLLFLPINVISLYRSKGLS